MTVNTIGLIKCDKEHVLKSSVVGQKMFDTSDIFCQDKKNVIKIIS